MSETDEPFSWVEGSKAVRVDLWFHLVGEAYSGSIFGAMQRWGEKHCCRFLLTTEGNDYYLVVYAAPLPNRRDSGLCEASVANRDKNLPSFKPWLEGFLEGRKNVKP